MMSRIFQASSIDSPPAPPEAMSRAAACLGGEVRAQVALVDVARVVRGRGEDADGRD